VYQKAKVLVYQQYTRIFLFRGRQKKAAESRSE
jgi:hypothetical protein